MAELVQSNLKTLPKVDRILEWPAISALRETHPRPEVLKAVRAALEAARQLIRTDGLSATSLETWISDRICAEIERRTAPSLRHVINGTGVVIHTNLGRSPLADEAEEAIHSVSAVYSNLEFDLQNGERGSRYTHVERLICDVTGAEAALVVNNNAAAVILALSCLAGGREVVVSRGELVEIGGSFRIPDVMRQSGAHLVEVGTTNRTHPRDYAAALGDATALLLKVHTSNFAIVGFTAETDVSELSRIGREHGIPVMLDAGSGCLLDLSPYGIPGEPTIRQYLSAGADVVTFSGDKLLGGPQAGLIAGRRDLIAEMKKHPLLRALRMDKLCLAALEATLRLYRDERVALKSIPTVRMLTMTPQVLARRAASVIRRLRRSLPASVMLALHQGESSPGGGSFPLLQLPTTLIEVSMTGLTPRQIEERLRCGRVPVIGRIHRNRFLLDVRTILDRDIIPLGEMLAASAPEAAP